MFFMSVVIVLDYVNAEMAILAVLSYLDVHVLCIAKPL